MLGAQVLRIPDPTIAKRAFVLLVTETAPCRHDLSVAHQSCVALAIRLGFRSVFGLLQRSSSSLGRAITPRFGAGMGRELLTLLGLSGNEL